MDWRIKSIVEQTGKETTIEREELAFALPFLHPFQFVLQIVKIAVKESFLLNEVAEHQTIEHHRSVPLLVVVVLCLNMVVYAGNEISKRLVLLLESSIKVLCNFFRVDSKRSLYSCLHVNNVCLLVELEGKVVYL